MVLVTGSSGFVGTALARRLLGQGKAVRLLGRSAPPPDLRASVEWLPADLSDPATLRGACRGCSVVFHTAAKVGVWGDLEAYRRVNVSGTEALLAEAADSGVRALVFTSSPSVVYHGGPLAGADESLPLTHSGLCPAAYPVSKAEAEKRVLAADGRKDLRTLALRPHLVWGPGDRHLIPRLLQRARSGRLRIVGDGRNRVDFVHIANCVDAHLLAAAHLESSRSPEGAGRAFFVTNGEPVLLWEFVKDVLARHGLPPVRRRIPLAVAHAVGLGCEMAWRLLGRTEEPPMTRFVASELAKDHWFSIDAARRILGYRPRVTMAEGLAGLPVDPDSDGRSSEPLEPASRRP